MRIPVTKLPPRLVSSLRTWLPLLVIAALLYLLLSAVSPSKLLAAAIHFRLVYLLPLLATYLVYLVLRALRWHLLLHTFGVPNSALDSILLFTGAQAALLIPAGQFLLPVLQKSQHGTLIRRSAATVLVQELLFGVLALPAALPGASSIPFAGTLLGIAFAISVVAGAVMLHEPTARACIRLLGHLPFRDHHLASLDDLRRNVAQLASTRAAIAGSLLDMAAIAAAGTSLFISLLGLGITGPGWIGATAAYAFGNAAAVVTSLPGGLGASEDTSTFVLSKMGVAAGPAAAGILIFRASTLLFGTALGWTVLVLCRRRFHIHPSIDGIISAIRGCVRQAEAGDQAAVVDRFGRTLGQQREP
ncbi:MAG TPA: lysylphosphatidylglycerol synthase transmembrane domain-containing protein [Chloroflexota bacterium]|nr:lysylphosphatidylglycerol synthase transmembrane domain-containing protein [Chloroflexota bacterium]